MDTSSHPGRQFAAWTRLILAATCFALLGIALTTGAAWLPASAVDDRFVYSPFGPESTPPRGRWNDWHFDEYTLVGGYRRHATPYHIEHWEISLNRFGQDRASDGWFDPPETKIRHDSLDLPIGSHLRVNDAHVPREVIQDLHGWPYAGLGCEWSRPVNADFLADFVLEGGIEGPVRKPRLGVRLIDAPYFGELRAFPLRPVPVPFLKNWLFWTIISIVMFLLLSMRLGLRRFWMRWTTRCPACYYDLREHRGKRCPECGAPPGERMRILTTGRMSALVIVTVIVIATEIVCAFLFANSGARLPAMLRAAQQGDIATIELLVNQGISVDAEGGIGTPYRAGLTPLMFAIRQRQWETVRYLLDECDANPNAGAITLGVSPLHMACAIGHLDTVRLLLEHGADPNGPTDSFGSTLDAVATLDDVELFRLLLENGATSGRDLAGIDALATAAGNGAEQIVRMIVADPELSERFSLDQAMVLPVANGDLKMIQLLADLGCDVNATHLTRQWRMFDVAVRRGEVDAARLLLQLGADPNLRDSECRSPLSHGVGCGRDLEMFRFLLSLGCFDVNERSQDGGRTPLHEVVDQWGSTADVARLLLDAGADPNARDDRLNTPLHLAAEYAEDTDVLQALLDAGADPRLVNDFDLTVAEVARDAKVRKFLERAIEEYSERSDSDESN